MDLATSVKVCFKKYATFEGRAQRSEFWYFYLFLLLLGICTMIIDVGVLGHSIEEEYTPINTLASVITLIPILLIIMFVLSVFLISKRESLENYKNSSRNIFDVKNIK